MSRPQNADLLTKVALIILIVVISYLTSFLVLFEVFVSQPSSMGGMMGCMTSTSQNSIAVNLAAFSLALLAGVSAFLWLKPKEKESTITKRDELEIIKRALSEDEKAVLDEIRRAGEITQDSLRFRLEWSKSKVSRILSRLDKMNLVQRERMGRTYNVFLTRRRPEE